MHFHTRRRLLPEVEEIDIDGIAIQSVGVLAKPCTLVLRPYESLSKSFLCVCLL